MFPCCVISQVYCDMYCNTCIVHLSVVCLPDTEIAWVQIGGGIRGVGGVGWVVDSGHGGPAAAPYGWLGSLCQHSLPRVPRCVCVCVCVCVSLMASCICLLTHSLTHSFTHLIITHLFVSLLIHGFIHSSIQQSVHLEMRTFIDSFLHSLSLIWNLKCCVKGSKATMPIKKLCLPFAWGVTVSHFVCHGNLVSSVWKQVSGLA